MSWNIFRHKPKTRQDLSAVAQRLILKGNYRAAIDKYDMLLAGDPDNVRALLNKADLLKRCGQERHATEPYLRLARIYSGQGFHLKAVSVLKQVVRLDPERIQAQLMLAAEYERLELTREAICALGQVAIYYDKRGMRAEMREMLRRIFDLGKSCVSDPVKLGDLYARAGMQQEAEEHYRQQAECALEVMDRLATYGKLDPGPAGENTLH